MLFTIPEIKRIFVVNATRIFVSENFELVMKNCQEMWVLYFSKTIEKSGMRIITGYMQ